MIKYLKNLGKAILDGFYSMGEGFSTFTLFPGRTKLQDILDRNPLEQDYLAMKKDWEFVGNDLRKAMDNHCLENNIKKIH